MDWKKLAIFIGVLLAVALIALALGNRYVLTGSGVPTAAYLLDTWTGNLRLCQKEYSSREISCVEALPYRVPPAAPTAGGQP